MKILVLCNRSWFDPYSTLLKRRMGDNFLLLGSKDEASVEAVRNFSPSLIFVPFWSSRIPSEIWSAYECIVFHMTDLPFGRGGSPLQNLISRGIYDTKISAIRCVSDLDAGPIYLQRPFSLHDGSAATLFKKAAEIIYDMIISIMEHKPAESPQVGEPTFFKRRAPAESELPTGKSITEVYDHIRMLDADGYPRAFFRLQGLRFELRDAEKCTDGTIKASVTIRKIE